MKETRVYEKKLDINTNNTRKFYDERAKEIARMECPYTSVLLGDQNPKHAEEWNIYEKEFILPHLKIDKSSEVLDVGCGMGRWAETIIPMVSFYLGTDFSSEMIQVARKRCIFSDKDYEFYNLSFQELAQAPGTFLQERKFNRVIVSGVCMYINDSEIEQCYKGLVRLLDEHCVLFLNETVAVEKRLTLNEHPSEALKTTYDVIYRTIKEYNEYYNIFLDNGFRIEKQEFLPHLNNEKGYSETERWYTILKR